MPENAEIGQLKIGVIGGGAWGTALAQLSAKAGSKVILWAREEKVVKKINEEHENEMFLKGVGLSNNVRATTNLADMVDNEFIFIAVPAQFVRSVLKEVKKYLSDGVILVLCAKGIEQSSGKLMTEVVSEIMPKSPLVVLSGPTFAREVALGLPSAVTIASKYQQITKRLLGVIGQPTFRPYVSRDIVGAEIGGALKNVFAIACGITTGRKMGDNARAALITRSLSEMVRYGESYGAERSTMMGLCGLGDLILTCSSTQSRNLSLGIALGEGKTIEDLMTNRLTVAEGYYTSSVLAKISQDKNIDMPIVMAVNDILHEGKNIDQVIGDLLNRPFVSEI
ncbi:MAG: NAD(P)H-dependent glycerol-3-phosphate dehydrogenase [Emcibacteraceae bacterium]|nr:NAD(P)-dependent glycerol-3-phosphate dehydrogenase [Emcibacteraceae bacterium]MDC0112222.1 NAD(P)-dependent glycerol-3-phosphate dehydrogenase [Emcibacteraceae bacterium]MDC1429055.1 NAD(P)-dependent glycerol-3-phosphate dehydrogenase [Emcibacteraceae bacterium]